MKCPAPLLVSPRRPLRVAIALGGTDLGRSGIGTYLRALLPRLAASLHQSGGALIAVGTRAEQAAYADCLGGIERVESPSHCERPAFSAAWHLMSIDRVAHGAEADVLLLPAANRRMSLGGEVPVVAVVHDLAQLHVPDKYDRLRVTYSRRILVPAYRRAAALVAISGATREDMVRVGCPARRIRIVPNGVDAERFVPRAVDDPRIMATRADLGLEGPYVLYPARLEHPGKNHTRLLRAFAQSPLAASHTLALLGPDWGARATLEEETRRLGIEGRVAFLGWVPHEAVPLLIAGADVVTMVGLCEGFGLPALEALACGRPLVAAETGALPEVTGNLAASCDPYDVDSIARALERAATDQALRERALIEGPSYSAGHSWDETASQLLETCYQSAA